MTGIIVAAVTQRVGARRSQRASCVVNSCVVDIGTRQQACCLLF